MSSYSDDGFNDYKPTTYDPGRLIFIFTLLFCLGSQVAIPFLVQIGKRLEENKKNNNNDNKNDEASVSSSKGESIVSTMTHATGVSLMDANSRGGRRRRRYRPPVLKRYEAMIRKLAEQDRKADQLEAQKLHAKIIAYAKMTQRHVCHSDDAIEKVSATKENESKNYDHKKISLASLRSLLSYDREMKRILRLAIPFVLCGIVSTLAENATMALVSLRIGTDAVTAYVVVDVILSITNELIHGILDSESTLCAHAYGAGNNLLAGQYVQLCTFLYIIAQIPCMIIWSFKVKDVMILLFDFNEEIAEMGQQYARVAVFDHLIDGLSTGYHTLLEVIECETFSASIDLLYSFTSVAGVAIMLIMYDGDLLDTAYVEVGISIFFLILTVIITMLKGWMKPFNEGMFKTFAISNKFAVSKVIKTAAPLAIGQFLTSGEWELLTFFAGNLGPAEVATWAIFGNIWDCFESSTEGFGDAAEIRVSYHLGKGNPSMAKTSGYKTLVVSCIFATIITCVFFAIGNDLPALFTEDPTLVTMMRDLMPLAGIGNIFMTFGMVSWALVGAQGRYRLATSIVFLGSWVITMPLGAIFCFANKINLKGLTAAVVLGYNFSGTALSCILLTSDWSGISKVLQEQNALSGEVESSDSESDKSSSSSSLGSSSDSEFNEPKSIA